jgi:hypothetical protein
MRFLWIVKQTTSMASGEAPEPFPDAPGRERPDLTAPQLPRRDLSASCLAAPAALERHPISQVDLHQALVGYISLVGQGLEFD